MNLKLKVLLVFMSLFAFSCFAQQVDEKVAMGLVQRLLPEYAASFMFEKLSDDQGDRFELQSVDGKIVIRGNNANSMAVGLNHYLKYYCNTVVSWYASDAISMPAKLFGLDKKVSVQARCKKRFFLNYCTFGYTMPWWKWRDWERFIDWMALNGVTMPLAITGQEAIWRDVWMKLGLTDQEIRHYFTGPAHLPWHRMLNLDYWQGDLPLSWLDNQRDLQKKIVTRERELNMTPVLPAFAGHVPHELLRVYPDAKISKLSKWGGFDSSYRASFLDPMDPLFAKIQKAYLEEQTRLWGTDHIYGIDLFNEVNPPSWEPEYLQRVARTVYQSLVDVDPKAVWLQMTWLFYHKSKEWTPERIKAFITAIPRDCSLLLDYYCDNVEVWKRTESYYGMPYIWCLLGNFGGNTMLDGNWHLMNDRIEDVFRQGGSNLEGLGGTLEGFDCNPFLYEYLFEKAWNTGVDGEAWIEHLADCRTGKKDMNARKAWKLLIDSIYTSHTISGHCTATNARPQLGKFPRYGKTWIAYNNRSLLEAWGLLLKANGKTSAYTYDVVNLARQTLGNYFGDVWKQYEKAYESKRIKEMKQYEKVMLGILKDMDELLATQSSFLLGKWIEDARAIGENAAEKDYFEENARNLITTWGGEDMELNDYANRAWAGLMSSFYAERWKLFFGEINLSIQKGVPFSDDEYHKKVTDFEKKWWKNRLGKFSSQPVGDGYRISEKLYKKYQARINSLKVSK